MQWRHQFTYADSSRLTHGWRVEIIWRRSVYSRCLPWNDQFSLLTLLSSFKLRWICHESRSKNHCCLVWQNPPPMAQICLGTGARIAMAIRDLSMIGGLNVLGQCDIGEASDSSTIRLQQGIFNDTDLSEWFMSGTNLKGHHISPRLSHCYRKFWHKTGSCSFDPGIK